MNGALPLDFELSAEQNASILRAEIIPQQLDGLTRSDNPRLVLLLGQSGSGKTTISAELAHVLDADGGCVTLDFDRLMRYHPNFSELQERFERDVQLYVKKDVSSWLEGLDRKARDRGIHVIWELTGSSPDVVRDKAKLYRRQRYDVEAVVLAVPAELSRRAVETRYRQQKTATGFGRDIPARYHDRAYTGLLEVCDAIDRERICDGVTVLAWGGLPLHANELGTDGRWICRPACREAVERGRAEPLGRVERSSFVAAKSTPPSIPWDASRRGPGSGSDRTRAAK